MRLVVCAVFFARSLHAEGPVATPPPVNGPAPADLNFRGSQFEREIEFPNLFLPERWRRAQPQDIPAAVIAAARSKSQRALTSLFNRMTVPIYDEVSGRPRSLRFFRLLKAEIAKIPGIDPRLEVMPSSGVVRSALGYLYAEMYAGMRRGIDPETTLDRVINDTEDIPVHRIRGVGSDIDIWILTQDLKSFRLVQKLITDLVEKTEEAYGLRRVQMSDGYKRAILPIMDVKIVHTVGDEQGQLDRSVRQGGATLDLLGFRVPVWSDAAAADPRSPDRTVGDFYGPREHPNIVDDFFRGLKEYVSGNAELQPKQTTRGIRTAFELPHLVFRDETAIVGELEQLLALVRRRRTEGVAGINLLDEKTRDQFAKTVRNSRFGMANNRLYRNEQGNRVEELINQIVTEVRSAGGPNLIPHFADNFPLGATLRPGRAIPAEYLVPQQTFLREYLPDGVLYHGTPDLDLALAILRGGFFESEYRTGFDRGTFTSPSELTSLGYAGKDGVVLRLRPRDGIAFRVFDARRAVGTAWGNALEAEARQKGLEVADLLTREYGVDLIINTDGHVLLKNTDVVDPIGIRELVDGYRTLTYNPGADAEARVNAYQIHALLHRLATDLGERGLEAPLPFDRFLARMMETPQAAADVLPVLRARFPVGNLEPADREAMHRLLLEMYDRRPHRAALLAHEHAGTYLQLLLETGPASEARTRVATAFLRRYLGEPAQTVRALTLLQEKLPPERIPAELHGELRTLLVAMIRREPVLRRRYQGQYAVQILRKLGAAPETLRLLVDLITEASTSRDLSREALETLYRLYEDLPAAERARLARAVREKPWLPFERQHADAWRWPSPLQQLVHETALRSFHERTARLQRYRRGATPEAPADTLEAAAEQHKQATAAAVEWFRVADRHGVDTESDAALRQLRRLAWNDVLASPHRDWFRFSFSPVLAAEVLRTTPAEDLNRYDFHENRERLGETLVQWQRSLRDIILERLGHASPEVREDARRVFNDHNFGYEYRLHAGEERDHRLFAAFPEEFDTKRPEVAEFVKADRYLALEHFPGQALTRYTWSLDDPAHFEAIAKLFERNISLAVHVTNGHPDAVRGWRASPRFADLKARIAPLLGEGIGPVDVGSPLWDFPADAPRLEPSIAQGFELHSEERRRELDTMPALRDFRRALRRHQIEYASQYAPADWPPNFDFEEDVEYLGKRLEAQPEETLAWLREPGVRERLRAGRHHDRWTEMLGASGEALLRVPGATLEYAWNLADADHLRALERLFELSPPFYVRFLADAERRRAITASAELTRRFERAFWNGVHDRSRAANWSYLAGDGLGFASVPTGETSEAIVRARMQGLLHSHFLFVEYLAANSTALRLYRTEPAFREGILRDLRENEYTWASALLDHRNGVHRYPWDLTRAEDRELLEAILRTQSTPGEVLSRFGPALQRDDAPAYRRLRNLERARLRRQLNERGFATSPVVHFPFDLSEPADVSLLVLAVEKRALPLGAVPPAGPERDRFLAGARLLLRAANPGVTLEAGERIELARTFGTWSSDAQTALSELFHTVGTDTPLPEALVALARGWLDESSAEAKRGAIELLQRARYWNAERVAALRPLLAHADESVQRAAAHVLLAVEPREPSLIRWIAARIPEHALGRDDGYPPHPAREALKAEGAWPLEYWRALAHGLSEENYYRMQEALSKRGFVPPEEASRDNGRYSSYHHEAELRRKTEAARLFVVEQVLTARLAELGPAVPAEPWAQLQYLLRHDEAELRQAAVNRLLAREESAIPPAWRERLQVALVERLGRAPSHDAGRRQLDALFHLGAPTPAAWEVFARRWRGDLAPSERFELLDYLATQSRREGGLAGLPLSGTELVRPLREDSSNRLLNFLYGLIETHDGGRSELSARYGEASEELHREEGRDYARLEAAGERLVAHAKEAARREVSRREDLEREVREDAQRRRVAQRETRLELSATATARELRRLETVAHPQPADVHALTVLFDHVDESVRRSASAVLGRWLSDAGAHTALRDSIRTTGTAPDTVDAAWFGENHRAVREGFLSCTATLAGF